MVATENFRNVDVPVTTPDAPQGPFDQTADPKYIYQRASMLCLHAKFPEARTMFEDLVAMMETTYGPEHPQVAIALDKLAPVLLALGDFSLARSTAERALKINETALGPHHA